MNKSELNQEDIDRINYAVWQGLKMQAWELVGMFSGGLTGAPVIKIRVKELAYVIKLEKFNDENFDLIRNYQIVETVSLQGISPKVYFTNADKGIVLMQYIENRPRPAASLLSAAKMAALIRRLHNEKLFPQWKSISDISNHFYRQLPLEYQQTSIVRQGVQVLTKLGKIIFDPSDVRSCHGDLNPNNWLFDGENYFLVDWQVASPQSFYFDLSCCAIFFYFFDEELKIAFLKSYLERDPTETERAKYYLMQIFSNIYFGIGFLSIPLRSDPNFPMLTDRTIEKLPTYSDFMQSIGAGTADLTKASAQQQFGCVFLKTAIKAMTSTEYKKALQLWYE